MADDLEDTDPDFIELSDEIALAALPGLLAGGVPADAAADQAYIVAEMFLMQAKPRYLERIVKTYGGIPTFTRDVPHDPKDFGV